jgi:acid phosphatase type 7
MQRPLTLTAVALVSGLVLVACRDEPTGVEERSTTPIVIAAAGDIAVCGSNGDEATAALLDALGADTILTLGDNVYENGTASEFANCYHPSWGRHKARTRPSPGNHDYQTTGAVAYYAYFGAMAGPLRRGYYSFEAGAWHLISLNSNVSAGAGSAQLTWMRADLTANRTACTLAYWHHPVISSGQYGNDAHMQEVWRVLDSAGVDVILVGHDHNYERFAPQTSTGVADPNGVREFVVGTGGASLRSFATIRANSEVRNSNSWGVLKMTLYTDRYDWQFIPVAGATFTDQGSANCVETGSP